MSDRLISHLCSELQEKCFRFLGRCNADPVFVDTESRVFVTQTYRGEDEQNADYAKGRTEAGPIITNAKYGESPHNCTLDDGMPAARAFDFGIQTRDGTLDWNADDDLWQRAIAIGEALGLVSGSTFHHLADSPHFELPDWKSA